MGVTGLWKLIDSAGKQITLESLEGKVFAVDASILLNQALKGMKDEPNAHLHVLFLRLCKLLMYKIKPIFVFDGSVPLLKRQTIAARQKRREEASALAQSIQERLKRKAVQRLAIDNSQQKAAAKRTRTAEPDLFELPPLPEGESTEGGDEYFELPIHNMLYSGDIDLSQVKIDGEDFKALPLEYQHEILEEMKEMTKSNQSTYSMVTDEKADNFSSFQIAKLVKSNKLTNKIEGLRKEMLSGLADHAGDPNQSVLQANRVMSEDSTHYLLIKNIMPSTPSAVTETTNQPTATTTTPDTVSWTSSTNASKAVGTREVSSSPSESSTSDKRHSKEARHSTRIPTIQFSDEHMSDSDHSIDGDLHPVVDINEEHCADTYSHKTSVPSTRELCETEMTSLDKVETNPSPLLSDSDSEQENTAKSLSVNADTIQSTSSGTTGPSTVGVTILHSSSTTLLTGDKGTEHCQANHQSCEQSNASIDNADIGQCDRAVDRTDATDTDALPLKHVTPGFPLASAMVTDVELMDTDTDDEECDRDVLVESQAVPTPVEQPTTSNPMIAGLADEILNADQDLVEVDNELKTSQYYLNLDLQKQQATSIAVTQNMLDDSMELLRLFGVPFVVSPSEAEAQCAQLELLGLCDGTITEDSDVWLFGGGYVLKNFFQQDRHLTSFNADDVLKLCGLDRKKLIAVALVCGSDYTDGILGAGIVTATEILSEFGQNCDGITAMRNFRSWIDEVKAIKGVLPAATAIRRKLRRHAKAVPDAFPNQVVIDAYLSPRVDDSREAFAWGRVDLDLLRKFAKKSLNWTTQKVDDLVCPVLKKLNSRETQFKMTDFLNSCPTSINASSTFQSKRLKHAFSKLISPSKNSESCQTSTDPAKPQAKPKSQSAARQKKNTKRTRKVGKAPPSVDISLVKERVCLSEESDDSD